MNRRIPGLNAGYLRIAIVVIGLTLLAACAPTPPETTAAMARLDGQTWVVEDIANTGIIDASRITLVFDGQGHLSGTASCNRYRANYDKNGTSLHIGPAITTRMSCAPALNNQEHKFLKILRAVTSYAIDATGKLILRTAAGQTLEAYPAG